MKRSCIVLGTLLLCVLLTGTSPVLSAPTCGMEPPSQPLPSLECLKPTPKLDVTKEITNPRGSTAFVGQTIVYKITVEDSGDTYIPHVPLSDSFDASCLEWLDSTPPADTVEPDGAVWTDLGSLSVYEFHEVEVRLKAKAVCPAAENQARVSGVVDELAQEVPPAEDKVAIEIVPGYRLFMPFAKRKPAIVIPPWWRGIHAS